MSSDSQDGHKSTRPSETCHSKTEVVKLLAAFDQFLNPFAVEQHRQNELFCLSSGQPASDQITKDLLTYVNSGEKAAAAFIKTHVVSKSVKFHEPLKKLKFKTFAAMTVKRKITSMQQNK